AASAASAPQRAMPTRSILLPRPCAHHGNHADDREARHHRKIDAANKDREQKPDERHQNPLMTRLMNFIIHTVAEIASIKAFNTMVAGGDSARHIVVMAAYTKNVNVGTMNRIVKAAMTESSFSP
ncbi:hypothetical protein V5F69_20595, partial [Xanthobacter sp. V2C-4]